MKSHKSHKNPRKSHKSQKAKKPKAREAHPEKQKEIIIKKQKKWLSFLNFL